jgi:hypothetical protein
MKIQTIDSKLYPNIKKFILLSVSDAQPKIENFGV